MRKKRCMNWFLLEQVDWGVVKLLCCCCVVVVCCVLCVVAQTLIPEGDLNPKP